MAPRIIFEKIKKAIVTHALRRFYIMQNQNNIGS